MFIIHSQTVMHFNTYFVPMTT